MRSGAASRPGTGGSCAAGRSDAAGSAGSVNTAGWLVCGVGGPDRGPRNPATSTVTSSPVINSEAIAAVSLVP